MPLSNPASSVAVRPTNRGIATASYSIGNHRRGTEITRGVWPVAPCGPCSLVTRRPPSPSNELRRQTAHRHGAPPPWASLRMLWVSAAPPRSGCTGSLSTYLVYVPSRDVRESKLSSNSGVGRIAPGAALPSSRLFTDPSGSSRLVCLTRTRRLSCVPYPEDAEVCRAYERASAEGKERSHPAVG